MKIDTYADYVNYYFYGNGGITSEKLTSKLHHASRLIDTLTYNRIKSIGFDNLTDYQKEIVKECCCKLADFVNDNSDLINGVINSYTINEVSVSYGGMSVMLINGVVISKELYALLEQSGLCSSNMLWRCK